jgi:hypothetical protein
VIPENARAVRVYEHCGWSSDDTERLTALIQDQALECEPPMRDLMQRPDNADFMWRCL